MLYTHRVTWGDLTLEVTAPTERELRNIRGLGASVTQGRYGFGGVMVAFDERWIIERAGVGVDYRILDQHGDVLFSAFGEWLRRRYTGGSPTLGERRTQRDFKF